MRALLASLLLASACSADSPPLDPNVPDYDCASASSPRRISGELWFDSSLATARDGLWVARSSPTERGSAAVVSRLGGDGTLLPAQAVLDAGDLARQPQLVATGEGFDMVVERNWNRDHRIDRIVLGADGSALGEPMVIASVEGDDGIAAGEPRLAGSVDGLVLAHTERRHAADDGFVEFDLRLTWIDHERGLLVDSQTSDRFTIETRPAGLASTSSGVAVAWSRIDGESWSVHAASAANGAIEMQPTQVSPDDRQAASPAIAEVEGVFVVAWQEADGVETQIVVATIDGRGSLLAGPVALDAQHTAHELAEFVDQRDVVLTPLGGGGLLVSWIVDDVAILPHFPVVVDSTIVHRVVDPLLAPRSALIRQQNDLPEGVQVEGHGGLSAALVSEDKVQLSLLASGPESAADVPIAAAVQCVIREP